MKLLEWIFYVFSSCKMIDDKYASSFLSEYKIICAGRSLELIGISVLLLHVICTTKIVLRDLKMKRARPPSLSTLCHNRYISIW